MCNLRAIWGKFGNTCEAATSFIRWEGAGTPSVPLKILNKVIVNSFYDQWSFLPFSFSFFWCNDDGEQQSCGGDVLESEKNPYQDRWKFSGWLCVIRPWGLSVETVMGNSMAFIFHKSHLKMQIMEEINCKHCKSQRQKRGKTEINRAITVTLFDKMLH